MATQWGQIAKRLEFGKEDIQHNRKGELSPNQKEYLAKGGKNGAYLMLGIAIIMTPIMWFASRSIGEFMILEAVVIIFCGLFAFGSRVMMKKDVEAGLVDSIVGTPHIKTTVRRGKVRKVFSIGEREFSDVWLHKLLNEKAQYRAYFAPTSGKLVAIEPFKQ